MNNIIRKQGKQHCQLHLHLIIHYLLMVLSCTSLCLSQFVLLSFCEMIGSLSFSFERLRNFELHLTITVVVLTASLSLTIRNYLLLIHFLYIYTTIQKRKFLFLCEIQTNVLFNLFLKIFLLPYFSLNLKVFL